MKKLLLSITLVSTPLFSPLPALAATTPEPHIYMVSSDGNFKEVTSGSTVSGVAPYQIHVSAVPQVIKNACFWDPTIWHSDGEHNLCDLDKTSPKPANLAATAAEKYFNTTASALQNPLDVESSATPSACFIGGVVDAATTGLEGFISECVRARDLEAEAQLEANELGNGNILLSSFTFNFGDASASSAFNQVNGFNAAHLYNEAGSYTLRLNIQNESGAANSISLNINVAADNRVPVLISSDLDIQNLLVNYPSSTTKLPYGNRHIQFAAGQTYHLPGSIRLFTNDWFDGALSPTANVSFVSVTSNKVFVLEDASNVVIENLSLTPASSSARGQFVSDFSTAHQLTFRNIQFPGIAKGFDIGGTGLLIPGCRQARRSGGRPTSGGPGRA